MKDDILQRHDEFAEKSITNRFFKHKDIEFLIHSLPPEFKVTLAGHSLEGRSLNLIQWGSGETRVFLWSQMHGDEATGTMALMDLCNYLQRRGLDEAAVQMLEKECTLYLLPMVNPDGAEKFKRRNALQIDINRDFKQAASPESKILKRVMEELKPHFGYNLHDQNTLWSVCKTGKPATLSYLAPAYDEQLSENKTRTDAMLVIADMFKELDRYLPRQIGLFDDEHEPRAFGDNFQLKGMSTILIEAGGLLNDEEKQEIRKYYFLSVLKGLHSIASKDYQKQDLKAYHSIPKNNKEIFHILIHRVLLNDVELSIGLNYEECPDSTGCRTLKKYAVRDIGDLSYCNAYHVFDETQQKIVGNIVYDENADFELWNDDKIILSFSNGILNTGSLNS